MATLKTFATKADQYASFTEPFPKEAIKRREQNGKEFFYYDVTTIRQRLHETFGGDYSFKINHVLIGDGTVDVSGILEVRWMDGSTTVVEEFGSSDVLLSKSSGKRVNDPMKAATSDCLKRCAAFIGCGLELWDSSYRDALEADGFVPGMAADGSMPPPKRFTRRG